MATAGGPQSRLSLLAMGNGSDYQQLEHTVHSRGKQCNKAVAHRSLRAGLQTKTNTLRGVCGGYQLPGSDASPDVGELIDFADEELAFVLALANVAQVDEHNIVSLLGINDVRSLLHHFVSNADGGDESMSDVDGWDDSETG